MAGGSGERFLYGLALQWSGHTVSLLVTFILYRLFSFFSWVSIFTSVMPEMGSTLIQSMIVMSVSIENFSAYRLPWCDDIKRFIKANGTWPLRTGDHGSLPLFI